MRWRTCIGGVAAMVALLAFSGGSPLRADVSADYVRGEMCAGCHEAGAAGDFAAGHGGYPVAGADCSSCHVPHAGTNLALLRSSAHPEMDCGICHIDPVVSPH